VARGAIVRTLFELELNVLYSADWKASAEGRLSPQIQNTGKEAIRELQARTQALAYTETRAVATEVFRKAANGAEVGDGADRLGETAQACLLTDWPT
jgi:exopolyphosphatase/pppGpp-phosphohydrolase